MTRAYVVDWNKPSVISTWFLKHTTHIFAGFGSINVPHSQHNLKCIENIYFGTNFLNWIHSILKIAIKLWLNITIFLANNCEIIYKNSNYLHFWVWCGIFLFNLYIWFHIFHFDRFYLWRKRWKWMKINKIHQNHIQHQHTFLMKRTDWTCELSLCLFTCAQEWTPSFLNCWNVKIRNSYNFQRIFNRKWNSAF